LAQEYVLAFDLRNAAGEQFRVRGGYWAVFLTLAECFGWMPEGTQPPEGLSADSWNKCYDSNDGQFVTDSDAISLAKHIHGAVVHEQLDLALSDIIANLEQQILTEGIPIHPSMKIEPDQLKQQFSPLLLFLYQGGFFIG
jgi:hypothetical protein